MLIVKYIITERAYNIMSISGMAAMCFVLLYFIFNKMECAYSYGLSTLPRKSKETIGRLVGKWLGFGLGREGCWDYYSQASQLLASFTT